ncbi:MAG: EthD domain-containing protein [Acidimicrobiales bacterium]
MIKVLAFIRRLPGMTPDEFHTYWRDVHAPRFAESPELAPYFRRYELNHRLERDYARERHPGEVAGPQWDGVAVQWFDSLESFREFAAHPAREEITAIDQPRFRALETASVITHEPSVIVDKPGGRERAGLKLICILRRNRALELPEFHEHWLRNHGGLFQNIESLNAPLLAYDQNHGLDLPGAEFDGVTEQWFTSMDDWISSLDAPEHTTVVEPDVAYMLDPPSIQFILSGPPTVVIG